MSKNEDHSGALDRPELRKSVFQVPEGYFDSLTDRLTNCAGAEDTLEQNEHLRTSVFETPEGYFDQLEERIKSSAGAISKDKSEQPVFEVPQGYFEGFESRLNERIKAEVEEEATDTVKVVPLYQRNWFQFAVAAVLILGFFLLRDAGSEAVITLDDLSNETMEAYLIQVNATDLDMIASVDGFDTVIDNILADETSGYDFDYDANPELGYDFEYLEQ